MTGRELWNRYSYEMAQCEPSVMVEDWDDELTDEEQMAWNRLAEWISEPTTMVQKSLVLDLLRGAEQFSMGGRLVQEGWIADLFERHFAGEGSSGAA